MRTESAASLKHPETHSHQLYPKQGTKLRVVYDKLAENKAQPVELTGGKALGPELVRLQDYYGLDIRHVGKHKWLLAGEWFGSVYVDYVAERFAQLEKEQGK